MESVLSFLLIHSVLAVLSLPRLFYQRCAPISTCGCTLQYLCRRCDERLCTYELVRTTSWCGGVDSNAELNPICFFSNTGELKRNIPRAELSDVSREIVLVDRRPHQRGPVAILSGLKYSGNVGTIVRSAVQSNSFEVFNSSLLPVPQTASCCCAQHNPYTDPTECIEHRQFSLLRREANVLSKRPTSQSIGGAAGRV